MKRKRLNRDGWGFEHFPYVQMRVDMPGFHGIACMIRLTSGEYCWWHMPKAGRVPVCGAGMTWLQLIPDGARHVLTAKFRRNGRVSVWYADVIDHVETDADGVLAFEDAYLDVIFSSKGDVKIDDRDELDAAFSQGEITQEQYERTLAEGEKIRHALCGDVRATERWCREILRYVKKHQHDEGVLKRNI